MKLTIELLKTSKIPVKPRKIEAQIYKNGYTDVDDYKGFRAGFSFSYRKLLTGNPSEGKTVSNIQKEEE